MIGELKILMNKHKKIITKFVLSLGIAASTISFLGSNPSAASGKYKDWDPLQIEQELAQTRKQLEQLQREHNASVSNAKAELERKLKELEGLKKKL